VTGQLPDDAVTAAAKKDTLVPDFPDLGRGIPGHDAWVAIAPAGSVERIAARAAADEREHIRKHFLSVVTANVHAGNDTAYGALLDAIRELGEARQAWIDHVAEFIGEHPAVAERAQQERIGAAIRASAAAERARILAELRNRASSERDEAITTRSPSAADRHIHAATALDAAADLLDGDTDVVA